MKSVLHTNEKCVVSTQMKSEPTYVQKDVYIWKETYIHEKRPKYMKRDLNIWKETWNKKENERCVSTHMKKRYLHKWKQKRKRDIYTNDKEILCLDIYIGLFHLCRYTSSEA